MSFSDKFLCFIFLLLGLTLGLTLAKTYENISYIEWNGEVNIVSLFSLITTIVIAFIIPFTVKRLIEDNRYIKESIISELKILIEILNEVKTIIAKCHESGKIDFNDKDQINYIFHEAELQLVSIREQIQIAFPRKSKIISENLTDWYFEYHNYLTGGELMTSKFRYVTDLFRRDHDTNFSIFTTKLKKSIHTVHKF